MTDEGPDENCISLKSHADMLDGMLYNINVHFQNDPILSLSEYDFVGLHAGNDAIILENTRMEINDEVGNMEKNVDKGRLAFNKLFDDILDYYIVDAFPTSHRASTTMSPVFDSTPVLFGPEFITEFNEIQKMRKRLYSPQPIMFGFGGAKFDKIENMKIILERKNVLNYYSEPKVSLLVMQIMLFSRIEG
ncbi:MAG: phosphoglycerate kinase [Candidatus Heimdallarchaeota archaeon]